MTYYSSLYDFVVTVIADILEIDKETLSDTTHIFNDLNIDSYTAAQILQVFDESVDIEINQEDFQAVNYISDIVVVLENLGVTVDMVNTDSSGESGENGNGKSGNDDISVISEDDVDESSRQASYVDVVAYTDLFDVSSRLLTYKNLLDTAKVNNRHYVGGTTLESKCNWETEKFTTTAATFTTSIQYNNNYINAFTVLYQETNNFTEFNIGDNYTHLLSFANTVTLAMRPTVQFAHVTTASVSDEDEGTDYGVSPASIEFDDEGSESGNIDDTGIAYSGRSTRASGPPTQTYAIGVCSDADNCGICHSGGSIGDQDITNPFTGVCFTGNNCANPGTPVFSSNCACGDTPDFPIPVVGDTCGGGVCIVDPSPGTTVTYTISFCATAFITGVNIGLASCSATMYTTKPYNNNLFDTIYMKIPKYNYFNLSSKPPLNFGISVWVTTDSTSDYSGSFCSVTGTIKDGQSAFVFNSNDKTMKTNIAQTIVGSTYLKK